MRPNQRHQVSSQACLLMSLWLGAEELQAEHAYPTHAFGTDPVFLRQSVLFDNTVVGHEDDYYNMTAGSPEAGRTSLLITL